MDNDNIEATTNNRQKSNLEKLALEGVYRASFKELSDFLSAKDLKNNPLVTIHNPSNPNGDYEGIMVYSTNERVGAISNTIRNRVIEQGSNAGSFNVRVIRRHKTAGGRFRTIVVATNAEPHIPKEKYPITAEEAFAVLRGHTTFYARYASRGQKGPCLMVHKYNRNNPIKEFRYLQPAYSWKISSADNAPIHEIKARRIAESRITENIIKALKPGDYLIVREIGKNLEETAIFVEPVVNFMEFDNAYSPKWKKLVTKVDGYDIGDIIHDLPIIGVEENPKKRKGMFGIGYARRARVDKGGLYYKRVKVVGAAHLLGKYVERAEMIKEDPKNILARIS